MEPTNSDVQSKSAKKPRDGIYLSKQTLDRVLDHERADDMIALLVFYHYTALWQCTNQPRATVLFVMRGLGWGRDKVRAIRRELAALGLIEDVRRSDELGRQTGCFVKLRFFHPTGLPESGLAQGVDSEPPNALRANRGNALRADNENAFRANRTRALLTDARSLAAPSENCVEAAEKKTRAKQLGYEHSIKRITEVCGGEFANAVKDGHILKKKSELLDFAAMTDADMRKARGLIGAGWPLSTVKRYKMIPSAPRGASAELPHGKEPAG